MKRDEVLKYLEGKDGDFVIRTAEEESTFLANKVKEVEEKTLPEKIKGLHDQYDNDIFSVTGQKKQPTEKTYDFLKRVLGSYKTDAEKGREYEKEISSLKEQIKNNSGDQQLKADLAAVQKQYSELLNQTEAEKSKMQGDFQRYKAESEIRASLPTNIKKNLPEEAVKALTNQVIDSLLRQAEFQDGKLVFKENGVVKRNPHNALNPYTAAELLNEHLKAIIDTGRRTEGGPDLTSAVTVEKNKEGKVTKVNVILPDSVNTKEKLGDFLIEQGLLRGTTEYNSAYAEYSPGLPYGKR